MLELLVMFTSGITEVAAELRYTKTVLSLVQYKVFQRLSLKVGFTTRRFFVL